MDFSAISSVKDYVKNVKLQHKWQQKKTNGEFTAKTEIERMIGEQRAQAQGIPGTKKNKDRTYIQNIHTKISSGRRLTTEEKEYLRDNDPVTYQRLRAAEEEEKSFDREIRRCKTKEDVTRVKMAHVSSSLAVIGSVKNSTEIPDGMKTAIFAIEQRKLNAIARIEAKFVASGAYRDLPTDEEKTEAERLIAEAKGQEPAHDNETSENASYAQETEAGQKADKAADTAAAEEKIDMDNAKNSTSREKLTAYEAQNSPEVQKLKRAKARAAYAGIKRIQDDDASNGTQINVSV